MKKDLQEFVKTRPPLFWWLLLNILAITFAISSWVVCLNLFRDPTHPLSYELMYKVGRVPALESYPTERSLPEINKTADAIELDSVFRQFSEDDLAGFNDAVLREYLTNYRKSEVLTCLTGQFTVLSTRKLDGDDFLSPGLFLRARATLQPEVDAPPVPYPVKVEIFYPGTDIPPDSFSTGQLISLDKNADRAALIHAAFRDGKDGKILFLSLVRLRSGPVENAENKTIFTVTPPEKANPAAFSAR